MYINDTRYVEDNENWVKDTTDYNSTNPWISDSSPSTVPIGDQEASFLKGLWNAIKKDVNATYDAEGAVTDSDGYNGKGNDGAFKIDRYYESPASIVFADNSGNVLKQSGNTVDVALTKPIHVNYVDKNGNAIPSLKDDGYDIDTAVEGSGEYKVPAGYQLVNQGGWTVKHKTHEEKEIQNVNAFRCEITANIITDPTQPNSQATANFNGIGITKNEAYDDAIKNMNRDAAKQGSVMSITDVTYDQTTTKKTIYKTVTDPGLEFRDDSGKNTITNNGQDINVAVEPTTTTNTENKAIHRDITITTPDGKKQTINQKVDLTRSVTKNPADNKQISATPWKAVGSDKFDAVDVPQVKGYTPSQKSIPAVDQVDENTKDSVINITYTPNQENAKLQVLDDDNGGKVVPGFDLTAQGAFNMPIHFGTYNTHADLEKALTDKHYQIVSDTWQDNKFDDGNNQFTIHVKHTKTPPTAQDNPEFNKTITRTIHFVDSQNNELASPTIQKTDLTRTGEKDDVTDTIDYSDWSIKNNGFTEVLSPKIHGYTPDKDKVAADTNPDTSKDNADIYVHYKGNEVTVTIQAVDKNGKILKQQDIKGTYGQPYSFNLPDVPGYHLAKNQTLTGSFGADSTLKFVYEPDVDPDLAKLRSQIQAKETEGQDLKQNQDYSRIPQADQTALDDAMQAGQNAINDTKATKPDLQKALTDLTDAVNKVQADLNNLAKQKDQDKTAIGNDLFGLSGKIGKTDKAKLDQDLPEMSEAKSSLAFAGIATALIAGLGGYAIIKKHKRA